jgi:hypothetical protein
MVLYFSTGKDARLKVYYSTNVLLIKRQPKPEEAGYGK